MCPMGHKDFKWKPIWSLFESIVHKQWLLVSESYQATFWIVTLKQFCNFTV